MIEEGRIVEPLSSFYKDEVRAIGRSWAFPPTCWTAIPSPAPAWPSVASARGAGEPVKSADGFVLPVRSVGVQGDSRTYRSVLAIDAFPASPEEAAHLVNRNEGVNRVVVAIRTAAPLAEMRAHPERLTPARSTGCAAPTPSSAAYRTNPASTARSGSSPWC